jgi:hypothetical protein
VRNYPRSEYRAGEYLFVPTWAFCINKAGNTEEAWQFLKFLLSDEVQSGTIQTGYLFVNPVNKNAVEMRIAMIRKDAATQIDNMGYGSADAKTAAMDFVTGYMNRYLEEYTKTRDALTTPVLTDPILEKSLLSAIDNMAAQKSDTSEIRAELTRIIDTYMNETGGDIRSGYKVIYIIVTAVAVGGAAATTVIAARKRKKARIQAAGVPKD